MNDDSNLPSVIELGTNLEDVVAPPPLPPGQYRATVMSVTPTVSQTSGNLYGKTVFKIDTSQYPVDYAPDNAPNGKSLTYNRIVIDPKVLRSNKRAMFTLRQWYEALGLPLAVTSVNVQDWIGQEVLVTISNRENRNSGLLEEEIDRVSAV